MSTIRPGYLKQFAEYLGISRQAAKKHLDRAGVNYRESFDFEKVARILDTYRHLGRDSYRKRNREVSRCLKGRWKIAEASIRGEEFLKHCCFHLGILGDEVGA